MKPINDKLLSFLGLCRRAGRMTLGNDVVIESMEKKNSNLVLLASDVSVRTKKGVLAKADGTNTEVIDLKYTKDELSQALGKYAAVISIEDFGFAKKIRTLITQQNNGEECNL